MTNNRDLSDGSLLQAVLSRDEQAWAELMRRYRGLIFRCITRVTVRYEAVLASEDANEIFADVCLNLLRDDLHKLRAFDPDRGMKLGSWLGLIAIHTTYDFLRTTARRPLLDRFEGAPERPSTEADPEEVAIGRERKRQLDRMMADFTERERDFVHLYFGSGMEPDAIAHAMNISVKTVYSKKNKIRSKLERLSRHALQSPLPVAA